MLHFLRKFLKMPDDVRDMKRDSAAAHGAIKNQLGELHGQVSKAIEAKQDTADKAAKPVPVRVGRRKGIN